MAIHATWCRLLTPIDTKRRATTGSGAAGGSSGSPGVGGSAGTGTAGVTVSTGGGGATHTLTYPGGTAPGPVTFVTYDQNGNRTLKMSFPDQAAADAYLKANFVLSPTGSVGANGTYDIFASNSAILEYGYIISAVSASQIGNVGPTAPPAPSPVPYLTQQQQAYYANPTIVQGPLGPQVAPFSPSSQTFPTLAAAQAFVNSQTVGQWATTPAGGGTYKVTRTG